MSWLDDAGEHEQALVAMATLFQAVILHNDLVAAAVAVRAGERPDPVPFDPESADERANIAVREADALLTALKSEAR